MENNQILDILKNGNSDKMSVCPWQEIRLMPHLHWQIDLILDESQIRSLNRYALGNSLLLMFYGASARPTDKYDPFVQYHNAANPQPLYKYYHLTPAKIGLNIQAKSLSDGWNYDIVDISTDYAVACRKRNDGRWDISAAQFCK